MAANFFDQFDPKGAQASAQAIPAAGSMPAGKNYFDQFDPGYKAPATPAPSGPVGPDLLQRVIAGVKNSASAALPRVQAAAGDAGDFYQQAASQIAALQNAIVTGQPGIGTGLVGGMAGGVAQMVGDPVAALVGALSHAHGQTAGAGAAGEEAKLNDVIQRIIAPAMQGAGAKAATGVLSIPGEAANTAGEQMTDLTHSPAAGAAANALTNLVMMLAGGKGALEGGAAEAPHIVPEPEAAPAPPAQLALPAPAPAPAAPLALPPPAITGTPTGLITNAQAAQVAAETAAGLRQSPSEAAAAARYAASRPQPQAPVAPTPAPAPNPAALQNIIDLASKMQGTPSPELAALGSKASELLANTLAARAGRAVDLTPGGNVQSNVLPATPEELQELDAFKARRAKGARMTPQQTAQYANLLEKSQNTARVNGQPIQGVLSTSALDHMRATLGKAPDVTGMTDLDNLKNINDTLGHHAGDQIISMIGTKMAEVFGPGNVVHRGGDEFVTLGDPDGAKMAAFQQQMGKTPITFTDAEGNERTFEGVKVSVGTGKNEAEADASLRSDKASREAANLRSRRVTADRRAAPTAPSEPDAAGAPVAPAPAPAIQPPVADVAGNGVSDEPAGIPASERPAGADGGVATPEPAPVPAAVPAAVPENPPQGALFSKARPGEVPRGTTPAEARAILAKASNGATTRMERTGALHIHPTGADIPGGDASTRALFDGRTLHVAANRVDPDTSAGLLMHEAIHSDLRGVLGAKYDDFMDQASQLAATDPIAREAVKGIPANTPAANLREEQAAHIAEFVANQKPKGISGKLAAFVRKFYHAVRSHILTSKFGSMAQKFGMQLNPQDIGAFARRAASRMYDRGGAAVKEGVVPDAAKAARPVGSHLPIGPVDTVLDKVIGPTADKISNGVRSLFASKMLASRGWNFESALSPDVRSALQRARTMVSGAHLEAEDVAHNSQFFSPEERKMVGDYIEGALKNGTKPPAHIVAEAEHMRTALHDQRERLIGVLGEDSRPYLEEHGDKYLGRFYEENLPKDTARAVKNAIRGKVKADFLRHRGEITAINPKDLPAFKQAGWTADTHLVKTLSGQRDDGKIMVWRDYTPEQRAQMGEINDGHYRFVRSFIQTEQLIQMHSLYKILADKYGSLGPEDGPQVPLDVMPGTKIPRYGALAGKHVPPEVAHEVLGGMRSSSELSNAGNQALNAWKYLKVANSRTVIADMIGKMIYSHLGGHSFLNPANVPLYARAVTSVLTKDADFRLAMEHGATSNDIISADDAANLKYVMAPTGADSGSIAANAIKRTLDVAKRVAGAPMKPWGSLLHAGTNTFKMAAYLNAVDHGFSPEQAAAHANMYHFDFRDVPPGMRKFQKWSAFANWTRLAVKAAGHSLLHSPHRYATVVGLFAAYHVLASLSQFGAQDTPEEEGERKALPKHMQQSNPMFLTNSSWLLPMKADNGDNMWLDTSSMIPGRDIAGSNPIQSGAPIPSWAMPTNPSIVVPLSVVTGVDPYTGGKLTLETDTPAERAEKIAGSAVQQIMPTEYGMIGQAVKGVASGHDYAGKPYGVGDALAAQAARVHKVGPEDVTAERRQQFMHLRHLMNLSRYEIRDAAEALAQHKISQSDYTSKKNDALAHIQQYGKQIQALSGG